MGICDSEVGKRSGLNALYKSLEDELRLDGARWSEFLWRDELGKDVVSEKSSGWGGIAMDICDSEGGKRIGLNALYKLLEEELKLDGAR